MNIVTLTCFYYPTREAMERAIQREAKLKTYDVALWWDLRKPVCAGEVTRFRNTIAKLHLSTGMNVQSSNGTMPGFMVWFRRLSATADLVGPKWDLMDNAAKSAALECVAEQRRRGLNGVADPASNLIWL